MLNQVIWNFLLRMPSIPVVIETATWRDLNTLRVIEQECFSEDAWPVWDLIAVLALPRIVRLKAVIDEEMVGFVAGDLHPEDHMGWVTTLGVRPQYRNQGIASALLSACEEQMAMPRIQLCVRRSNETAQRLYLKHGYKQVNVWQKYYQDQEDALILEKKFSR
jgi:ribosomal protein S18 acetylase RimI-like enzyme